MPPIKKREFLPTDAYELAANTLSKTFEENTINRSESVSEAFPLPMSAAIQLIEVMLTSKMAPKEMKLQAANAVKQKRQQLVDAINEFYKEPEETSEITQERNRLSEEKALQIYRQFSQYINLHAKVPKQNER